MGASVSTNSSSIINKALTDVSKSMIQESIISNDNSVFIRVQNTKGDVEISNAKITQKQSVNMDTLFTDLQKLENQNKVNEEISQIAKSMIEGLNLIQAGVSTSTLSNIIDNCIKIKDEGLFTCKTSNNQVVDISVDNTSQNVKISDINIEQISDTFFKCVTSTSNGTTIANLNDVKIKQLSSSSVAGIDVKWFALAAAAAGIGGIGLGGSVIKQALGPIMMTGGAVLVYLGISKDRSKTKNTFLYLLNPVSTKFPSLRKLKSEKLVDGNVESYGEATLYETFKDTITLYDGNVDYNALKDIKSEIVPEVLTYSANRNVLTITFTSSTIHTPKNVTLPFNVTTIYKVLPEDKILPEQVDRETVCISDFNVKYTNSIKVGRKDASGAFTLIEEVFIDPSIITYKEATSIDFSTLLKNPLVLLGVILIITGIATITFSGKNTNKSSIF